MQPSTTGRTLLLFLCFLIVAEGLSWFTSLGPGPCLIQQENHEKPADHDKQEGCPTFYTGSKILLARIDHFIESNDKSIVAVFTIVLALSTIGLWISTHKLWSAGEKQIVAAQTAADAALKSAETAEKALVTTERAFVFIDGFNVELTTAADSLVSSEHMPDRYREERDLYITRFAVQPRWKNSGNTPTRRMTIQVDWRGPPGPIPPDYIYRKPPKPFFLAPQAIETSAIVEMPGASVLVDWGLAPTGVEPMVFIWGRADYEDVFGGCHFVEWCYQLRLERHTGEKLRAGFIQWGDYNRSD